MKGKSTNESEFLFIPNGTTRCKQIICFLSAGLIPCSPTVCHKSPQEFRNPFYSSTNLIRHTRTEILIQPPLTPSCHAFAFQIYLFIYILAKPLPLLTCQFLIVSYLGVLSVDFNESCLLACQISTTSPNWPSIIGSRQSISLNFLNYLPSTSHSLLQQATDRLGTGSRSTNHLTERQSPSSRLKVPKPLSSSPCTGDVEVPSDGDVSGGRLNAAIRQPVRAEPGAHRQTMATFDGSVGSMFPAVTPHNDRAQPEGCRIVCISSYHKLYQYHHEGSLRWMFY